MNLLKGMVITGLALVAVFAVSIANVSAQEDEVTQQQVDQIVSSCVSTKNTLKQLHASDALLRVNRGQIYESISTKLMNGFNNRVSNNNFDNSGLLSVTKGYNSTLDIFRTDYMAYENSLASAINIDCFDHPVIFYNAISSARSKRNLVHADIVKLNQSVGQYKDAINKFEKDFQNNGETN